MTEPNSQPDLSVVIPIYNEEECLPEVLHEVRDALEQGGIKNFEVVCVDDGSRDRSAAIIAELAGRDGRFRLLRFVRNCGQTAAFDAGLRAARGRLVGMMDGDGQNDPHDFPALIKTLEQRKVDLVNGIRAKRQDSVVRKISSRIGNGVRNWAIKETVSDVGCQLRVFRRECLGRIKLYEGMHRFFPTLFRIEGYTIDEIPVNHRPRTRGKSKYGIMNRLFKAARDLYAVRWMQDRALRYQIRQDD